MTYIQGGLDNLNQDKLQATLARIKKLEGELKRAERRGDTGKVAKLERQIATIKHRAGLE